MSLVLDTMTNDFLRIFTQTLFKYFEAQDEHQALKPEIENTKQLLRTIDPRRDELIAQQDLFLGEAEFWREEIQRLRSEVEEMQSSRQVHILTALMEAIETVESERQRILIEWRVYQAEWKALDAEDRILHNRRILQAKLAERVTQVAYEGSLELVEMRRSVCICITQSIRAR